MPEYYYDKDNGRKVTKAGFVKDNRGLTYYLDEKGEKVLGLHESMVIYITSVKEVPINTPN